MPKSHYKPDRPAVFAAALIVAVGGLIYELLLGTVSSYLFGDSITSFSISIGTMLFGMGVGSLLAKHFLHSAGINFVRNELLLSFLGGNAVLLLFLAFSFTQVYWLVFVLLSVGIGICIGMEIPLMVSLARGAKSKGTVHLLSNILALDYIGALLASLLFPFLLLPHLGLVRTAYLVATLNIMVALFIMHRLNLTGSISSLLRLTYFGVLIWLMGCFVYADRIEKAINTSLYKDPVVYYHFSPYQKIAITNYRNDVRLYLNDQLQFSSIDEARYHETLAHAAMTSAKSRTSILVLGGGDGLLARELVKYPNVTSITIVDIDPAVTSVASDHRIMKQLNHNVFDDKRVKVVNQDAYTFTAQTNQQYDVVLSDLVDPANDRVSKLYSKEFYQNIHQVLGSDGIFITQATSSFFTPNAFAIVQNTISAAFENTHTITPLSVNVPSFGEWGFVLATPPVNRLFSETDLPLTKYATTQTLSYATQAIKPSATPNTVSTLLNPKIYQVYREDMRQWRY